MVLGVNSGAAQIIGLPVDLPAAKKSFGTIVREGGVASGRTYEEVWLVDTAQGRLRRKAFCHAQAGHEGTIKERPRR
jgi:hypothetical protein